MIRETLLIYCESLMTQYCYQIGLNNDRRATCRLSEQSFCLFAAAINRSCVALVRRGKDGQKKSVEDNLTQTTAALLNCASW